MPEWKELYCGNSIKSLQNKAQSGFDFVKLKTLIIHDNEEMRVFKTLEKCHSQYLESKLSRDQEMCYIYLFKFVELYSFLQKECKDQKYLKALHGKHACNAISELEQLDRDLNDRYKKLETPDNVSNSIIQYNESSSIVKHRNFINSDDKDNQKKLKSSIDDKISLRSSFFINCKELKDLIDNANPFNVLIMDVRSEEEFRSRVKIVNNINIPKSILLPGDSASMLSCKLPDESKDLWSKRTEFENIVLMDNNTNADRYKSDIPICVLRDTLTKWDYPTKCKKPPLVLSDGFSDWCETYPFLTINPGYSKIFNNLNAKPSTVTISDIQYPDSDEESKKINEVAKGKLESIVPQGTLKAVDNKRLPVQGGTTVPSVHPHFDRSSKPKLDSKNSLDNNKPKKPLMSIHDTPVEDPVDEPAEKNLMVDDASDSIQNNLLRSYSSDSDKENFNPTYGETVSGKENLKNYSEYDYVRLKSEPNNSGSPGLKKSLSSPNISKLDDNMAVLMPKNTPEFDRSNKPKYHTPSDTSHHGYQEKQPRFLSHSELEGAVMGAHIVRGLTGLKNLGNTCYMNSILQCISNTQVLRIELCRFSTGESFKNHKSKTEGLIAKEIQRVLLTLWMGNVKYFSCHVLKSVVGKFRNSFKGSEQQDSHEFFTILMDWLHEDLNEPSMTSDLSGAVEETGEKSWGEFKKKNNSIVLDLFYGQQKSTVRCDECGKQSVTFEPFSNLSLLLPSSEDSCTLNDCLDLYLKQESITGWNCPKCKTPQNATKKVDITRLPAVLVIHFKRFTSNGWCRKKQTYVNFPITQFDMKKYTAKDSEQRNEVYSLYAVSNHYGTMESGHYTAYCLNSELNRWFKFDDQEVSEISSNDVKSSAAYILFYSVKR